MESKQSSVISTLLKELMNSHWPKCNSLAQMLADHETDEARDALVVALGAKRHHVRTAVIRALVQLGDPAVIDSIRPLVNDPAYETRVEAKNAVGSLEQRETKEQE